MKHLFFRLVLIVSAIAIILGCGDDEPKSESAPHSVAVFVPGVVAGSPTYEALVAGVESAAAERDGTTVKVVEGGFNQGEWIDGVTALAASGIYDTIITSNPAMPEICEQVALQFPNQKFIVLDGHLSGNESIHTIQYNQMEQSYLIGHLAGLISESTLPGANPDLKVGLIAGQEYPIMNGVIRVGFELGMQAVDPAMGLDFRVLGNWYDASRASELASIMYDSGVDVILAIAGGANQGVLSEARRRGTYVLWFDGNGYAEAPGVVLGSSALEQRRTAYEKILAAIDGSVPYGSAEVVGVADGYVTFIEDDPLYIEHVPEAIRSAQSALVKEITSGKLRLAMPRM